MKVHVCSYIVYSVLIGLTHVQVLVTCHWVAFLLLKAHDDVISIEYNYNVCFCNKKKIAVSFQLLAKSCTHFFVFYEAEILTLISD